MTTEAIQVLRDLVIAVGLMGGSELYRHEFGRVCFCGAVGLAEKGPWRKSLHSTACDDVNKALVRAQQLLARLEVQTASSQPLIIQTGGYVTWREVLGWCCLINGQILGAGYATEEAARLSGEMYWDSEIGDGHNPFAIDGDQKVMSEAFVWGMVDFDEKGCSEENNPFPVGTPSYHDWLSGLRLARERAEQQRDTAHSNFEAEITAETLGTDALLQELREVEAALSPENVACDGELLIAQTRRRVVELTARRFEIIERLGYMPSKEELWPEVFADKADDGTSLTIAEYLALPAEKRPAVSYNGEKVTQIYRDPTYPDADERYVIRLGARGAGSKRGDTRLSVCEYSEAGDVS